MRGWLSPLAHYDCMSRDQLAALPVGALAHQGGCAMVMWATAPLLPLAIDLIGKWGFTYKTAGAWAKRSSTDTKWAFGTGYCYRSAAEFFLLGTRGKPVQQVRNVRNLIVAPVRQHSRKPDRMRQDLETLWPGPRCELFAREAAEGWDSWGNEATKFNETGATKDA